MKPAMTSGKTKLTTRAYQRQAEDQKPTRRIKVPDIKLTALEVVAVWLALPTYKPFLIDMKTGRIDYEAVVFPQATVLAAVEELRQAGGVRPMEALRMMPVDPRERNDLIRRAALEMKVGIIDKTGELVFNPYEYLIRQEERRSRRRESSDEAR